MDEEEDVIEVYQFAKLVAWEVAPLNDLHRYNIAGILVTSKPIDGMEKSEAKESGEYDASKVIEVFNVEAEELIEALRLIKKRKAILQGRNASDCIADIINM